MSSFTLLLVILWLIAEDVRARTFESGDAEVRSIISQCVSQVSESPLPDTKTACQATLGCILNTVDNYTAGRWSAGASILAFIPTLTGLMGNSIDEIVLVAEESRLLALLLGLCSITAFSSRFGSPIQSVSPESSHLQTEHFVEELRDRTEGFNASFSSSKRKAQTTRWVLEVCCALLLLCGCAAIWHTVEMLYTNGVVILSCPWRIHTPLWLGITQLLAIVNVLLRKWSHKVEHIQNITLQPAAVENVVNKPNSCSRPALPSWQQSPHSQNPLSCTTSAGMSVTLRCKRKGWVAYSVHGITSLLSFVLYAFSTAILGSMTMIPASDAIRSMALMCASVGLGRVIAKLAMSENVMFRRVIIAEVPEQYWPSIKRAIQTLAS